MIQGNRMATGSIRDAWKLTGPGDHRSEEGVDREAQGETDYQHALWRWPRRQC
jgi:hypothetical protein